MTFWINFDNDNEHIEVKPFNKQVKKFLKFKAKIPGKLSMQ